MENTNTFWRQMSDTAIVKEIGKFVKHTRLQQNITQAKLATNAGLNRYTVGQIENGESITLSTLIQLLRALDALYVLEYFTIKQEISPVAYAEMIRKQRKRASDSNSIVEEPKDLGW